MDKKAFEALVSKSKETDLRTKELISLIVRQHWHYYNLFIWLAKETKPNSIVELGTNKGLAALAFRIGSPTAEIRTVDIVELPGVGERMKKHNIKFFKSDASAYAKNVSDNSVDILFLDANHYWGSALKDFFTWYHKVKKGGIILLDDIGLEGGAKYQEGIDSHMPLAWECIKEWGTESLEIEYLHPVVGFGVVLK